MQPIKTTILSLTLAAAAGAVAHAQNAAPAPSFTEPQAFNGYSQPEIKDCKTIDATKRVCNVPGMTAGRYVIGAAGTATSKGANPIQALQIRVGATPCSTGQAKVTDGRSIAVKCGVMILTDQPLTITADYAVKDATADAKGPQIAIERVPWNGVLNAEPLGFPAPKPEASAKPAPKKSEAPAQ
jgi:hypothetical protein